MHLRTPHGRRVFHHLGGKVELFHHSARVAEHAGSHVAYVQIIVGALDQRVVQLAFIVRERARIDRHPPARSFSADQGVDVAIYMKTSLLLVHTPVRQGQHLVQLQRRFGVRLCDAEAETHLVGRLGTARSRGERSACALDLDARGSRVA